jgi:hypothetical protein
MMRRIRESLIFPNVVVWDNSECGDYKTAGRYMAMDVSDAEVVYFQDDDVIVPATTQQALLDAYEPGVMVAVYGHGENDGGYGDLPLVCGGAIVDSETVREAYRRYFRHYPLDEDFLYYCDFAVGVLYPEFRQLHLPFHIELPVAQHPSRLCNQRWAADMKQRVTEQARQVRDMVAV